MSEKDPTHFNVEILLLYLYAKLSVHNKYEEISLLRNRPMEFKKEKKKLITIFVGKLDSYLDKDLRH